MGEENFQHPLHPESPHGSAVPCRVLTLVQIHIN